MDGLWGREMGRIIESEKARGRAIENQSSTTTSACIRATIDSINDSKQTHYGAFRPTIRTRRKSGHPTRKRGDKTIKVNNFYFILFPSKRNIIPSTKIHSTNKNPTSSQQPAHSTQHSAQTLELENIVGLVIL